LVHGRRSHHWACGRSSFSSFDSTFLDLEQADDRALMHIGGALIFNPPMQSGETPSRDDVGKLLGRA
jgi:hypothetical protein